MEISSLRGLGAGALMVLGTASAIGTLRLTRAYVVEGDSMRPTLNDGDYVSGWRLPGRWRPRRVLSPGAIVVARRPDRPGLGVIKRIAARDADDSLHLAGDNPAQSTDSRHFGPVAPSAVESLVWLRYWPPGRMRLMVGRFRPPADSGWIGHAS